MRRIDGPGITADVLENPFNDGWCLDAGDDTQAAAALAHPSKKWLLQFSGSAKTSGVIVIQLSPVGSDPISISIEVPDNTSENKVAKIETDKLREALPSDAFHAERDVMAKTYWSNRVTAQQSSISKSCRAAWSMCASTTERPVP